MDVVETRERDKPPLIFITGGSGNVGSRLLEVARLGGFSISSPPHTDFDLAKLEEREISNYLRKTKPSFVINCTAVANVDLCENPEYKTLVLHTNVLAPVKIALACEPLDIPFAQISSDYVLSGRFYPHFEDEELSPVDSIYAQSKAEAERELLRIGGRLHIIRIQRPFTDDLNVVKRSDMLRDALGLNLAGKPFFGITDQKITPIYVTDCARAILTIMESREYGIWHVSSSIPVDPYMFVKMGFEELVKRGVSIKWDLLKVGKFDDFKDRWKAPRPQHTAFNVGKYESNFGQMRPLQEQLSEWAQEISKNLKD